MAGSLNKVMLIGRLTRDPEMRYTAQGTAVTNFGLATNRYLPAGDSGERREQTDFHDIVVFNMGRRNLAEIVAQYTKKGALVYIEGRLQTRTWEDQQGQKRRTTEVVANDVQFLETRAAAEGGGYQAGAGYGGPSQGGGSGGYENQAPRQAPAAPRREQPDVQEVDPDDIPF
ncbi:MAG: single-stranded DNA-binding protein [Acidimicrobiaceae bacterium]|nr:single-stranded DNA-binding protein [Candidatus Dormibacteraeota bacterium]MBO0748778.1 single-stranded DNA-binding protein [Acidimicrobiaceae bacterium]